MVTSGKGRERCDWFWSLIAMGKQLLLILDVQAFKLLHHINVTREKREWSGWRAFLTILPASLMQCTMKIDCVEGSDQPAIDRADSSSPE